MNKPILTQVRSDLIDAMDEHPGQIPCVRNPKGFDIPDRGVGQQLTRPQKVMLRQAQIQCYSCPVLQQCNTYAQTRTEPYGVMGGEVFDIKEKGGAHSVRVPLGQPTTERKSTA